MHNAHSPTCPGCLFLHLQATVVFREGITALLGGGKLPANGLCARAFKVQFAARNGAGYSAVATSSATYVMPACRGEMPRAQRCTMRFCLIAHMHACTWSGHRLDRCLKIASTWLSHICIPLLNIACAGCPNCKSVEAPTFGGYRQVINLQQSGAKLPLLARPCGGTALASLTQCMWVKWTGQRRPSDCGETTPSPCYVEVVLLNGRKGWCVLHVE